MAAVTHGMTETAAVVKTKLTHR